MPSWRPESQREELLRHPVPALQATGWWVCRGTITEEKGEGCPGARTHLSSCAPEPWGGRDGATGRQEGCRDALLPKQLQEGTRGSQENRHRGSARVSTGNSFSKHTRCTPSPVSQPRWAGRARSALLESSCNP